MEQEADIDSLLDGVPLEEPDAPAPAAKPAPGSEKKPDGEKPAAKADADDDKSAEKIDARIQAVLKKHLPNPEAACLMVDILAPGQAIVGMKGEMNLSPRNHFLLAVGGVLLVALATNPEVVARLRAGLRRKRGAQQQPAGAQRPAPQQKQLPAPTPAPAAAPRPASAVDAALERVELEA